MSYRAMMRRHLLEKIYDGMSEDEKRAFVQLSMQDRGHREIMTALDELKKKADSNHHLFTSDLLANIAGNGIFDGAVWLLSRLVKRL